MNPRLERSEHEVLPLLAAVRRLTVFKELSDSGRSAKNCQGPDSAASEIPLTPCRSHQPPQAIGL